jgi:hypothetical protein
MSLASRVHDTLDLISPHDCSELRNELNALLTAENYMALEARCIREFGLAAGVLARQLVYWEGKGYDPNGWTYKTKAELREEVGLSSAMVDTAQRRLEDRGVLRTDRRPKRRPDGRIKHPSPVIHYQLDLLKLAQVLGIFDDGTTLNHESKPQEFITFNRANSHPSTTRNAAFHIHRHPLTSTLAIWPSNTPHRLGALQRSLGLFSCRSPATTRKKNRPREKNLQLLGRNVL